MGEKVKLLVEIFISCEKFEKFDYQTFWSRFALGQPEKFDFQTFRRKSQKFAQKERDREYLFAWKKRHRDLHPLIGLSNTSHSIIRI